MMLLTLLASALAQDDPEAERAALKLAEGYEINLFASERDGVVKPIQMRFDARGRLWVACTTTYPQPEPGRAPCDKILILEDTDGKGRVDKTTVFADDLVIPTGLELGDGGVYVGQGSELLHLRDTRGDGRANERRVVWRGFGTADNHQNINSFVWSPGGELFFCQGFHSFSAVETPWGVERLDSAGIWRFRPRRRQLDAFYGNNQPGREGGGTLVNPWGIIFDRWGQPIAVDGCCVGIYHLTPGMIRQIPASPQPAAWKAQNFKICGADLVESRHFPDDAQGLLIGGTFYVSSVDRFRIEEDGSSFRATRLEPLIKSSDPRFRIVDVRFGPDGALYLCDWYNPIIGHYQASFRHPQRDKSHGRIWRVTARGRPLVPRPNLAGAPLPVVLDALRSPERYTRYQARRVLAERPRDEVVSAIRAWLAGLDPAEEHPVLEALGVLESLERVEPDLLRKLLRAKEPRARAYATRCLERWRDRLPDALDLLAIQAADAHPRVRLEAVVAASYFPSARAIEIAAAAMDQPTDAWIDWSFALAVRALKPQWRGAFLRGDLTFDHRVRRLEAFIRADSSADTVGVVVDRVKSGALDRATREAFLSILAEVGGPAELALLLNPRVSMDQGTYDPGLHSNVLSALVTAARVRRQKPAGDLAAALAPLLDLGRPALAAEAVRLAGAWRLEPFRSRIEAIAFDTQATAQVRIAATEALGMYGGEAGKTALGRLAGDADPTVRCAAISSWAGLDATAAAKSAVDLFLLSDKEASLGRVFSAFLAREDGAAALQNALAGKALPKAVAELGLQVMNDGGRRDEGLARILSEAAGVSSQAKELTAAEIAELAAEVKAKGDARRGAELFASTQLSCVSCHSVGGKGGTIGPDLSFVGTAYPVDFLIESVLYPNKVVKEGFSATLVGTRDGEIYHGYLLREDASELVLRDLLQNKDIRIRKDSIRKRKITGSPMPAGLADRLTRSEFRDLVRYLSELGRR